MAGAPELTPAAAVYGHDEEDVVWTWTLGKYRQVLFFSDCHSHSSLLLSSRLLDTTATSQSGHTEEGR